jgi:hypothetical protein
MSGHVKLCLMVPQFNEDGTLTYYLEQRSLRLPLCREDRPGFARRCERHPPSVSYRNETEQD